MNLSVKREIVDIRTNLNRETLVDRIVGLLEDRVLSGELLPGMRVSEAGIANEFGVSRVPAREALQRLQEMNLLRKTHLGREVAKLSIAEFREIYELKNVVEAFGAMKGAFLTTDQDLKKIQSVIRAIENCTKSGDLRRLRHLNIQFHNLLVYCSRNQKLIQTYLSLAKQVRWIASLSLFSPNRPQQSLEEHKAIFEAFKCRDGKRVRTLLEKHTNNSMERSLHQLELKEGKEKSERSG